MTEGHGKSSIAPLFQSGAIKRPIRSRDIKGQDRSTVLI